MISASKMAAVLWLSTSTLTLGVQAQNVLLPQPLAFDSLQQMISNRSVPLEVRLGDMGSSWIQMKLGGPNAGADNAYVAALSGMIANVTGSGHFYSQGQNVTLGGETYLIAYRVSVSPEQLAELLDRGSRPKQLPLTPDTRAALSLVNLRHAQGFSDIQSVQVASRAQSQQNAQTDQIAQSTSNLKQLGLGVMQYTQDYDERLPPMKSAAAFKKVIMPYVKSSELFVQPSTQKPYQPNAILSGKDIRHIANPSGFVMIYETSAGSDGKRAVAFLDGHVARVSQGEWDRLKKISKIK